MIEYEKFILYILKHFYTLHNLDTAYFESFVDDSKTIMIKKYIANYTR